MYGHTCAKNHVALRRGWPLAVAIATPMIAVGLVPRSVLGQESGGQTQLEEIIVTATKQAAGQDVSKVPISITAFDGKMIDIPTVKRARQLLARTMAIEEMDARKRGALATLGGV